MEKDFVVIREQDCNLILTTKTSKHTSKRSRQSQKTEQGFPTPFCTKTAKLLSLGKETIVPLHFLTEKKNNV